MIHLDGKYTSADIFAETIEDGVYQQVYDIINSKAFDGQKVVCMPDVHVGASGPCGLVATIGNYLNPLHIGVDVGCSVSLMVLSNPVPADKFAEFEHRIRKVVPFGHNIHEHTIIDEKDFRKFLTNGFNRYRNYWPEMLSDLPNNVTEDWITSVLRRISMDEGTFYKSIGSVGGGNHFIEYDENDYASIAGVTLHFGSRNFGKKVCEYWSNISNQSLTKREIKEATKQFKKEYMASHDDMTNFSSDLNAHIASLSSNHINGYLDGDNMRGYLCDMCFAQLYAEYNHKTVQGLIADILSKYGIKVGRVITSVHNFIDLHDHTIRKSSIRSYDGEELLIPFNMRDGIAVCEGLSNATWLNSAPHGAGRRMSRSVANKTVSLAEFEKSMEGIYSTSVCQNTIDESPMAYKDTDEIVSLIQETCKIKFMLRPRINIKSTEATKTYGKPLKQLSI